MKMGEGRPRFHLSHAGLAFARGKRSGTTLAGAPLNAASASKCRRFPRSCMGQVEPWAGNSSFLRFVISLDSSVCSAAKKRAFALFFGCFMALILLAL